MTTDNELGEHLIKAALDGGAELVEVYQRSARSLAVDVKNGEPESVDSRNTYGYGIRVVHDGRPGFSFSNDPAEAKGVVSDALETAANSAPDPNMDMPVQDDVPEVQTVDEAVPRVTEDEALHYAAMVESGAREYDSRVCKIRKAAASFGSSEVLIMNSRGLVLSERATSCSSIITAIAEEGEEAQMGFDYSSGRNLDEVDFSSVGAGAARRAIQLMGARHGSTAKVQVLLDPMIASQFLSVLAGMLSADSVQKGRSLLAGKVGERVFHETLTIIDNGLLATSPARRAIDGEGVPISKKVMIGRGVLAGYLYDTRTAKKDGVHSTGNAVRGGYAGTPRPGAMSLYIEPAATGEGLDGLMAGMDKGLCVTDAMGVHTIDPVTGEFSIGVSGLWIEGGKVRYPVNEAVISGSLSGLLSSVISIGNDLRFFGSIGSPSMLLGPVDLSA